MSESLPYVSVIVPVFNGTAALRICLRALGRQTYPQDRVQVIVVDNNSTENVAAAVPDDPRFLLLHEPQQSSYAARNTGIRHSTAEIVAFTDADCRPHDDWLAKGVEALRAEPRAAMVGGVINLVYGGRAPRTGCEIYESNYSFKQDWYLAERKFAATANVLTWRSTLDKVGVFDGSLQSRGDAQWGQRVAAAGGLQRFAKEAVVDHPARASWREFMTKTRRVSKGQCDVAIMEGRPPRHFLRGVIGEVRATIVMVRTYRLLDGPVGSQQRVRYATVFLCVRAVYVATWTQGLLRWVRNDLGNPRRRDRRIHLKAP